MLSDLPLYTTIPVTNIKQSIEFYCVKLGMDIIDEDEAGVWIRSGNSKFAIYQSRGAGTSKNAAAIWFVHNLERFVKDLSDKGIVFEDKDSWGNKIKSKDKILKYGQYKAAWFKDPSGNIICVASHKYK